MFDAHLFYVMSEENTRWWPDFSSGILKSTMRKKPKLLETCIRFQFPVEIGHRRKWNVLNIRLSGKDMQRYSSQCECGKVMWNTRDCRKEGVLSHNSIAEKAEGGEWQNWFEKEHSLSNYRSQNMPLQSNSYPPRESTMPCHRAILVSICPCREITM